MRSRDDSFETDFQHGTGSGDRFSAVLAGIATSALAGYLSAVFFLNSGLALSIGSTGWYVLLSAVFITSTWIAYVLTRAEKSRKNSLTNYSLIAITSVVMLVGSDTAFSLIRPLNTGQVVPREEAQLFDARLLIAQLYPRLYYPGSSNFRLQKPLQRISGSHYGNFYHPDMRNSPLLVSQVLEERTVEFRINELGFREDGQVRDATMFALGDSLTFGWGVNVESSWAKLLSKELGAPIYNLGIHDASPHQEVELLEHVLKTLGKPEKLETVLWMIYEGNDLEDSYSESSPTAGLNRKSGDIWENSLLGYIRALPGTLQRQSIINRLSTGEIVVQGNREAPNHHEVEGVTVEYPLYESPNLGYRLFFPAYVERAQFDVNYLVEHHNYAKLEATFSRMRSLSEEHDFKVVVIAAPTASRLHGPYFTDFPKLSGEPHFIRYVESLAAVEKMAFVDLLEFMSPLAGSELFYFRDDDHWNPRGNQIVAEIVKEQEFSHYPDVKHSSDID